MMKFGAIDCNFEFFGKNLSTKTISNKCHHIHTRSPPLGLTQILQWVSHNPPNTCQFSVTALDPEKIPLFGIFVAKKADLVGREVYTFGVQVADLQLCA